MRLGVEAALVDGRLVPGDVEVRDGRVHRFGIRRGNGRSGIASPGFVDLQVNGFGGVDFANADAAAYDRAGEALLETGVTSYLPTLITAPEEALVSALREVPPTARGPRILGVHVEGPFLAAARMLENRPSPDYYLLSVFAFVSSFRVSQYGLGAAISVVMVLLMLSVSFVYVRQMIQIAEVDQ